MARLREDINPEILGWARERAGFDLEKAAKKIGLSPSKKQTARQKLVEMENGNYKPTRAQLFNIAQAYWSSVAIFYIDKLPVESKKEVDFRSTGLKISNEERGRLDALIRNIYERQNIVKGILEDDEDEQPRSFVGSLKGSRDISKVVEVIKKELKIQDDTALDLQDDPALDFQALRECAHEIGVFVLLVGDLGNYSTKIDANIFRGFAIADPIAPFIIINPYDSKNAMSFTLIHELVHIFLGSTGISGDLNIKPSTTPYEQTERFCNMVASHLLLPSKFLEKIEKPNNVEMAQKIIEPLAKKRKVSEPMVAYRLWSEKIISKEIHHDLCELYTKRLSESKKKKLSKSKKGKPSESKEEKEKKISNISTAKHPLGKLLINFVKKSLNANEITYTKAGQVLRIKAISVGTFISDTSDFKKEIF